MYLLVEGIYPLASCIRNVWRLAPECEGERKGCLFIWSVSVSRVFRGSQADNFFLRGY